MRLEKTIPFSSLWGVLKDKEESENRADRVREVRLRWPDRYVKMLKEIARTENMSMNALVAACVDDQLVANGHPSVLELAPEFADYLKAARSPLNRSCPHCGIGQDSANEADELPNFD